MKVGVVVRTGPRAEGGGPARYAVLRAMALRLEDAGLDSIWLYDHLLYRWPGRPTDGIWECWTILSALAEATQRVELGTLVLCAPLRNPALMAKMAATLDEVSNGRLTLGLGAGWHQPEFDAFGVPFDHRASRFAEAISIIKPLLHDGRVDFQGTYYAARNCELIPRGPRPSGPPLLVAGSGPRMLEIVARHADVWNTAWHDVPESVRAPLETIRAACDRVGRDPATLEVSASVAVAYPELGQSTRAGAFLSGDAAEVADALHGYAELGIGHVIVEVTPFSEAALDRFAEAVQRYRASGSDQAPQAK
jgi:probable F420-dependent oxidoreductase